MFNYTKKSTWQTHNVYDQEFGDIWSLLAQKNFPLFLPKHWWYCLLSERVRPYNGFQNWRFENVNDHFSTENVFIGTARLIN